MEAPDRSHNHTGPSGVRQTTDTSALDVCLIALLKGREPGLPFDPTALANLADAQGVAGLVLEHAPQITPSLHSALLEKSVALEMWEARHTPTILRVVDALADAGCEPLIFKGTALAHTLYARPALRPKGDTDILIASDSWPAALSAMEKCGLPQPQMVSGDLVARQLSFVAPGIGETEVRFDLHRFISNSPILSRPFPHADLLARSDPVPTLGPSARAPSTMDALLIAAVHRLVHYAARNRLIWLVDIQMLYDALNDADRAILHQSARAVGLTRAVADGLIAAATLFDRKSPNWAHEPVATGAEPVAKYLHGGPVHRAWADLCGQQGVGGKSRYLQQVFFPSPAYMRAKYPGGGRLPNLYARRILGGISSAVTR